MGAVIQEPPTDDERSAGGTASYKASLPGGVMAPARGDTGADSTAVPWTLLRKMKCTKTPVEVKKLPEPCILKPALNLPKHLPFTASARAKLDILLELPCGPLLLRNTPCLVVDQEMEEILLGRPLLRSLGLDLDSLLTKLVRDGGEVDVSEKLSELAKVGHPLQQHRFIAPHSSPIFPRTPTSTYFRLIAFNLFNFNHEKLPDAANNHQ